MTRWARFEHKGSVKTGLVDGDTIVAVDAPTPLDAILGGGNPVGVPIELETVRLLAPLIPIRNVFCVGWNYLPHFEEGAKIHGDRELPERPAFFTKATGAVTGPFDPVPIHTGVTEKLDWEVELGVVIGVEVTGLAESDAMRAVAGFVVAQDITARDVQQGHGGQWFRGKSLDRTCPIGPWLVDSRAVSRPHDLAIECSVNGVVKQSSNTSRMIFPIPRLLSELTRGLTLYPGDILLTGTPEGVGQSRQPPKFLRSGDELVSTIEAIGTIRNALTAG